MTDQPFDINNMSPSHSKTESASEECAHPKCSKRGKYPAPRSRDEIQVYHFLCLEHVRQYNANWNYHEGMDEATFESEIRRDTVWRRPTWPIGTQGPAANESIKDPLDILGDTNYTGFKKQTLVAQTLDFTPTEWDAVNVLGLVAPVTITDVKQRYKILVKELHPDANGDDKKAEDRLKLVNNAYKTLRDCERLM
ncbi:MAG: DnaJ domain-containing protein [Pseudomonadota bacterium]|nr:DnaJ domain-containing protein [Pseudomonadota bacterium]